METTGISARVEAGKELKLESLTKQQLILSKQFFLENPEDIFAEDSTCDKDDFCKTLKK